VTIREHVNLAHDDLPPARLYLDDLESIVELFRSVVPEEQKPLNVTYTIGKFECTELEELKNFGERTSELEISLERDGFDFAYLRTYKAAGARWNIRHADTGVNFRIYGELHALFEIRKTKWKAACLSLANLKPVVLLVIFLALVGLVSMIQEGRHLYLAPDKKHFWPLAISWAIPLAIGAGFSWGMMNRVIVEFRRAHDPRGMRRKFAEWKPYILAAVVGGVITKALDLLMKLVTK